MCFFDTMVCFFERIKLVELDSEMEPNKAIVLLLRIDPFDVAKFTLGQLVDLLEELGVVQPGAFVQLYYHDGDDFISAEVGMEGWPESCCDDKCFKVWYRLARSHECSCSGSHVHDSTGKRFKSVTSDEFEGYRLSLGLSKFSLANDVCIGPVPDALMEFGIVEQALVKLYNCKGCVVLSTDFQSGSYLGAGNDGRRDVTISLLASGLRRAFAGHVVCFQRCRRWSLHCVQHL
jgi:hypothetical protein